MKVLGVDIGSSEVKTVLLEAGLTGGHRVTAAAAIPVTGDDRAAAVAVATRGSFDLVVLSIDRKAVVTRNLTLPFKELAQVAKVVPFEAESHLPFTADKGYIDHCVVDTGKPAGTDVLVFAISQKDFDAQRQVWEAAGLPGHTHQVDSFAIVNALLSLGAVATEETVAVVDSGHTKTSVEILRGGRLAFSRCINFGGDFLTRGLARSHGISAAEAEERKLKLAGESADSPDCKLAADAMEKLAGELKFTFLSYQAEGAAPVSRIVLTGGNARLPGLRELLTAKLGVPAVPAESARPLPEALASDLGRLAGAYGMALSGLATVTPWGAGRNHVHTDFLKEGRSFWKYHRKKISTAITGVLVLALAYVGWQLYELRRLSGETARLDAEIAGELEGINKANQGRGRKSIVATDLTAATREAARRLGMLQKPPTSNIGILNEISRLVPRGPSFIIRAFSVESGLVTVQADTISNDSADQITDSLKKSKTFDGVRKTESGPSPELNPGVRFKIQFKVMH